MWDNFSCFCCHLLTFFKINFFKNKKETRLGTGDPDRAIQNVRPLFVLPMLFEIEFCKNLQTTNEGMQNYLACKELIPEAMVNILFPITRPCSAIGSKADCRSRGHKFDPGLVPYFCED